MKILILLIVGMALIFSEEIKLANGQIVSYEELVISPDLPQSFMTAKTGKKVATYRYSEVDVKALPEEKRDEVVKYIHDQLAKRMIIKDDKWIHRDEMLLNGDKRYAAKGKLPKVGPSIIDFKNTTDRMVTIAVRSGDKGYEMHIEAGKNKGYQAPNGKVYYVMAQESDDGEQLIVQKSAIVEMKNVNLQVTIVTSDQIPKGEMGTIDIPKEYQVKPGDEGR